MKALSLTQPWAHAVVHLGKRVENRDWRGCSFRGPFLIHASKSVGTIADFDETIGTILDDVELPVLPPGPSSPEGYISRRHRGEAFTKMGKRARSATPAAFRDLLVGIAQTARPRS